MKLLTLALFSSLAFAADASTVRTVDHVDLQRYAGKWFEVARLPNRFERKCQRDVTAEYIPQGKQIRVVNTCIQANGEVSTSNGRAKVVDGKTGARLKVTFFWPFYGDYWILGLDPDYRWAVVGGPDRKYLWVLSRTASLPKEEMDHALQIAEANGYSLAGLIRTRQTAAHDAH